MPKIKCQTVYTAQELKDLDGRAFNRALDKYRETLDPDYVSSDMFASLKGLCAAAGVAIRGHAIGAYNRGNYLRVEIPGEDAAAELTGTRAMAWMENNVLSSIRIPWTGKRRWDVAKYGDGYRPGQVKSCPFTGTCYDEDFLYDVLKSIKEGRTLKEAFEDLADVFARMLEDEYEYQGKEEQFLEMAAVNALEFDADGDMV